MRHKPSLADFLNLDRWYRLQDHLCQVLGVPLRSLDLKREYIVNPSWPSNFPVESAVERLRMGDEIETLIPRGVTLQSSTSLTTVLEATYSIIPLSVDDATMAYFLAGPMVLGQRGEESAYCERMREMGLDGQALWSTLLSLKSFSYTSSHGIMNMLECVGNSVLGYAYRIYTEQHRVEIESERKSTMLRSLLQAASLATQADGGSVMVYDSSKDALTIRMAEGLSDAVVRNTRVPIGESLAGWAASQSEVRLLDDSLDDPVLRRHMRRRDVVSSLIAPLRAAKDQEAYGVLNLRVTDPTKRFTQNHVRLVEQLLELTYAAV